MKKRHISVSTGAILLFAVLYFFDDSGLTPALFPAVIVHEFGHALMIFALGGSVRGMRLDLTGLRMDFRGDTGTAGELAIAAAGPAMGLLYAAAASALGVRLNSEFLICSAGISAVLTAFNLLPALPLDGGRIVGVLAELFFGWDRAGKVLELTGLFTGVGLLLGGLWCMRHGYGMALLPAGFWILLLWAGTSCKRGGFGIQ
jgi:stage IV sporulation protein FB